MSKKEEVDCLSSKSNPRQDFGVPSYAMDNPVMMQGLYPRREILSQYSSSSTAPMAIMSTNTTTVPSANRFFRPISSPTRNPTQLNLGFTMSSSDNPTQPGEVKFQIMRRKNRMQPNPKNAHSIETRISEVRGKYLEIYLSGDESKRRDFCSRLIAEDAPINTKYKQLDLAALLNQNLVQSKLTYIVQALGIQEKYASNLLKDVRPQFWRTVKFTSSLWKTYLESMNGSVNILMKMGYTKQLKDGLSFPDEVREPDIERVKEIAADLYLAKIETDDMIHDRHPYLVIVPIKKDSSFTLSEEKVHAPTGKEIPASEDSDSEYEDAKDGLSNEDDTVSHQVPTATLQQESSSPAPECFICGSKAVVCFCNDCKSHFCEGCDVLYHNHPDRVNHARRRVGNEARMATGTTKRAEHEISSPALRKHGNIAHQTPSPTRLVDDGIKVQKPIPKPRKRIPSKTTRVFSPGNPPMANIPSTEELPPPIFPRTVQRPAYFAKNVSKIGHAVKEKVPQQPTAQSIEREILRPPIVTSYQPVKEPLQVLLLPKKEEKTYESLKDPEPAHIYETLDEQSKDPPPPPLPPKPRRTGTTTTQVSKGATSCPHCYCLNTPDALNCVACGTKLREQPSVEPTMPPRHEEHRVIHDPWQSVSQPEFEKQQGIVPPFSNAAENQLYFSNAHYSANTTGIQAAKSAESGSTDVTMSAGVQWSCEFCTLLNPIDKTICDMCAKSKTEGARIIKPSPVSYAQSPKVIKTEPVLSSRSLAVKLQEEEFKFSKETLRNASESSIIQTFQTEREKELLQTKQDDNLLYRVQQLVPSSFSPTSSCPSYPSVFSSSSEGENQEFVKSRKETLEPRREISFYKEIRETRESGQEFVRHLKKAESLGFAPEELNIAYTLSVDDPHGPVHPVHWLQTKWFDLIHQVMIKFTDRSKKEEFGNLSPEEARQALIERTGDVESAVVLSIEERKKGLKDVMASGFYPRTECLSALDRNDGDVDKSIQYLQSMSFQPMLQRMWDSCLADDADGNYEWLQQQRLDIQMNTSDDDQLFEAIVSNKELDKDRRIRVILAEKNLMSWGRAETAVRLVDAGFLVYDSIEAAQAVGDFDRAKKFLQRECILCADMKSESQMVTMLNCQCRFCRDCVKQHVTIVIQEQNIMKLVCPDCGEPKNLDNDTVATEYFNNLDIMIRRIVDEPTHDLFQRKLRDRTLMKEPNFRWCSHCSSGFINERPDVIKMACPHCRKYTCFKCKKPWEDQHEGISCEQFAEWREVNDPEAQAHGLAAHLKQNGIECPNCKFRYDLAKGGCMHFKCNQCQHEFCSGCYQPFRQGNNCRVSDACGRKGLHAHHPRDCLFYLRDRDSKELMKLLDDHNVPYDTEPPQRQGAGAVNQAYQVEEVEEVQGAAAAAAADVGRCKVMEQRETNNGLQDAECGRETPAGYAGLCRVHFKEYLVEKINANLIDPLGMYDIQDLEILIQRNDQVPPAKKAREKDASFRERLIQFVQAQLPLPKMPPRRRVLNMDDPVADDQVHLILNEEQQDGAVGDELDLRDRNMDALINDGFDEDILIGNDYDDYDEGDGYPSYDGDDGYDDGGYPSDGYDGYDS